MRILVDIYTKIRHIRKYTLFCYVNISNNYDAIDIV